MPSNHVQKAVRQVTLWGMALNLALTAAKFVVGFVVGSQSCVADAVHSLSDSATDLAVLVGVRFWAAPADSDHPHGHQRIEALITLAIGVLLGISAIGMICNAIKTIGGPTGGGAISSWSLLGVAVVSIFLKEVLYQWTTAVGRACGSSAVLANAWHHRSDAVSSIPVAIVAIVGRIWPEIHYLDHVAAVLVACMLLRVAWKIAWPALKELSDQGVSALEVKEMCRIASGIAGVLEVHKLRTRWFGNGILLDMHVLVDKDLSVESGHRICEEVASEIKRQMPKVQDVLTHLEPFESTDLKGEMTRLARQVPGVQGVRTIQIRSFPEGNEAECCILVEPECTMGQAQAICNKVRQEFLASQLKIIRAVVHAEPFLNEGQ